MRTLLAVFLLAAAPAFADTTSASSSGFDLVYRADVPAAPGAVFDTLTRVQDWWNPAHTYSGKSANLRLEPRAGGCFCESWDGGSVEHARVVQVLRDRVLRLEGALGPLQAMGVTGIWHFEAKVADGKTSLTMTYRVRGNDAGLDKVAPAVDKVMAEQFGRLVSALAKG